MSTDTLTAESEALLAEQYARYSGLPQAVLRDRIIAIEASARQPLEEALREVDRTYRAHLDAWNGNGHPGVAHDRDLHQYHSHGESPEESGCNLTRDDCAGCAGAMYGSDVEHGEAHDAARAALREPVR